MPLEEEGRFWVTSGSSVQGDSSDFSQEDETLFKEYPQLDQEIWLQIHHMVQEANKQLE